MKINLNLNSEYTKKNNVKIYQKDILNPFIEQKTKHYFLKPNNITFKGLYKIRKDSQEHDYYRSDIIKLKKSEAIKYILISLVTSTKNLINKISPKTQVNNEEQIPCAKETLNKLTPIGKVIAQKRGLLNKIPQRTKQFNTDDVVLLTTLSDEEFKKIKERNLFFVPERKNNQFDARTIHKLAKIKDKKFKKIKQLFYIDNLGSNQLNNRNIYNIACLSPDSIDNAIDLLNSKVILNRNSFVLQCLDCFCELSKNKIKTVKEFLYIPEREKDQFYQNDIIEFANITNEPRLKKIKKLAKKQTPTWYGEQRFLTAREIFRLSSLNNKQIIKAIKLFHIPERKENQFSFDEIFQFARMEKKHFERAKSLFFIPGRKDNQFSFDEINNLIFLNHEKWQHSSKLLFIKDRQNRQFPGNDILKILSIDDNDYSKAEKLFYIPERKQNQFFGFSIEALAKIPDEHFHMVEKYSRIKNNKEPLSADTIVDLIDLQTKNIFKATYQEKLRLYRKYQHILKITDSPIILKDIEPLKGIFNTAFNCATMPIEVTNEEKTNFFKNFIVINNTKTKEILTNLSPILEEYKTNGLPLKYPRKEFIKKLNTIINPLFKNEKNAILNKLDIKLTEDSNGYDGLLQIHKLNTKNKIEKEVKEEVEKFLLQNEIITGDKKIDTKLNQLIKAIPEFINMIGKKQHSTHKYTVDCHTLKVLEEAIKHPNFEILTPQNKLMLQMAIIFHDFGKAENVVDSGHEIKSAHLANGILKKFNLSYEKKDIIVEFIKNHDWFAQFQNKHDYSEIALMFRNPQGLEMAEIFANSDLRGVSEDFYQMITSQHKINIEKLKTIQEKIYQTGNLLFTTQILNSNKIPTINYKGKEYKVIDFTQIPDDEDLYKYGLGIHKKSDFKILFHTGKLNTLNIISSNPTNSVSISTSLISIDKKKTYDYTPVGFMLENSHINIIDSFPINQSSSIQKGFDYFLHRASSYNDKYRINQREIFLKTLKEKFKIKLTENEYSELYKKLLNKKFLSQITDEKTASTFIPKKAIIEGIKAIENDLLENADIQHNENNLYNPKIKGIIVIGNSLSVLNEEQLNFARKNNLPIFIMGYPNLQ